MQTPANPADRTTTTVKPGRAGVRPSVRFVLGVVAASASAFGAPATGWASRSPAVSSSVSTVPALAGTWQSLPAAPIASGSDTRVVSVWTGREMFVFARAELTSPFSVNAAAAYNPTSGTWRKLAPPPGLEGNYEGTYAGVWTGKEVLVVGPTVRHAFNPVTNHWRRLSSAGSGGLVVWTGREMIGWGGGCCGDASAAGTAYNPARHTWRTLPKAPLSASQQPVGAWTGRELIVLVSGIDPQGKRYPASLARAAAYNPTTNTWRRIAPLPVPLAGAKAVWDGRELLVVGAGTKGRTTFVYRPATNRWLLRAPMPRRVDGRVIWTTNRLMLWTGRGGLAYNPNTNRWSVLPQWPFAKHVIAAMTWTGRALLVWSGGGGGPQPAEGAAFTPTRP